MRQVSESGEGIRRKNINGEKNGPKKEEQRRKTGAWAYAAGMLFLAAALAVAFFLPEYYSSWQEGQFLNHVNVEEQQQVQLPEAHMVIAKKMQTWMNMIDFELVQIVDVTGEAAGEQMIITKTEEALKTRVEEWVKFGLLPEAFLEEYNDGRLEEICLFDGIPNETADETTAAYWIKRIGEETDWEMDFIMDADGSCLYYASFVVNPEEEKERHNGRWYHDGDWEWNTWEWEDMEEGGSFRAKDYCQAEYSRTDVRWGKGLGVLELLYGDFEVYAMRCRLSVGFIMREKQTISWVETAKREGFAVALGGPQTWGLTREANWEQRGEAFDFLFGEVTDSYDR